jgi:hypothetical protein
MEKTAARSVGWDIVHQPYSRPREGYYVKLALIAPHSTENAPPCEPRAIPGLGHSAALLQERCGFSVTSLSWSAIRPSSGSERAFILCIALLRWTFTVASAMPISPAICLLRRPRAT